MAHLKTYYVNFSSFQRKLQQHFFTKFCKSFNRMRRRAVARKFQFSRTCTMMMPHVFNFRS